MKPFAWAPLAVALVAAHAAHAQSADNAREAERRANALTNSLLGNRAPAAANPGSVGNPPAATGNTSEANRGNTAGAGAASPGAGSNWIANASAGRPRPVGNPYNASNLNNDRSGASAGPSGSGGSGSSSGSSGRPSGSGATGNTAGTGAATPTGGSGGSAGATAAAAAPTSTATVTDNVGSSVPRAAAQAALEFHNQARREVGTQPLEWSVELAAFAQKWATHLATAKGCRMEHRPRSGEWGSRYGENIFWGSASSFNARDASKSWYDEIRDFRPGVLTGDNWYKTGHYTQMVWKSTTRVGLGQAICPNGAIIIVGNYDPPGNYMGQAPY